MPLELRDGRTVGPRRETSRLQLRDGSFLTADPSITETIGGGIITGLRRDPFTRPAINAIASTFGVEESQLQDLEYRLADSKLSDVFEVVGEYGPSLLLGAGAYSVARRGGVAALAQVSPRAAAFASQSVGGARVAKPAMVRAAEIAGGSAGIGAFAGGHTLAGGGSVEEALKAAATTAVFAATFETGITLAGKALFKRARETDFEAIQQEFRTGEGRKVLESVRKGITKDIDDLESSLSETLGKQNQVDELIEAAQFGGAARQLPRLLKQSEQLATEATEQGRQLNRVTSLGKSADEFIANGPIAFFTSNGAFNPSGMRALISRVGQQIARTPEGQQGRFGPNFARFFQLWRDAESMTIAARDAAQGKLNQMQAEMGQTLGLNRLQLWNKLRKDRAFFLPAFDAWERDGANGVRALWQQQGRSGADAAKAIDLFQDISTTMSKMYDDLVQMGALPALTREEMRAMGVRNFVPHRLLDLSDDEIRSRMVRAGMSDAQAVRMLGKRRSGLAKDGSIDFNREVAGSLKSKVDRGMPFDEDPFNSVYQYMTGVARRQNYGARFGFDGELRDGIVSAAVADGANPTLVTNLVDIALKTRSYDQTWRQASRILTGLQTGSKLTFAVIPNLSQSVNTVLVNGLKATLRGQAKAANTMLTGRQDEVVRAVALQESLVRGVATSLGETSLGRAGGGVAARLENFADTFAKFTLRGTGFAATERFNRLSAGYAARYVFRDKVAKGVSGRLRGETLSRVRRQMDSLGVDFDDVVLNIQRDRNYLATAAGREVEEKVMLRGAQQTQFGPGDITRRPIFWNDPVGRVLFQFKTFALNQTRLITDQVFAEAARGNLRPMAYFMSIYPIAGEIVGDVRSIATGRERDTSGIARAVEDIMYVGGIGVATDTLMAARWGRLTDFLLGPSVSDGSQFAEAVLTARPDRIVNQILRQPVSQATIRMVGAGALAGEALDDYIGEGLGDLGEDDLFDSGGRF